MIVAFPKGEEREQVLGDEKKDECIRQQTCRKRCIEALPFLRNVRAAVVGDQQWRRCQLHSDSGQKEGQIRGRQSLRRKGVQKALVETDPNCNPQRKDQEAEASATKANTLHEILGTHYGDHLPLRSTGTHV